MHSLKLINIFILFLKIRTLEIIIYEIINNSRNIKTTLRLRIARFTTLHHFAPDESILVKCTQDDATTATRFLVARNWC